MARRFSRRWGGIVLGTAVLLVACARAFAQVPTSIVVEHRTGAVLLEDGADAANYPASLTKMMTLYLVFEAMRAGRVAPATRLRVSAEAARQPPSKLGLEVGSTIRVEDAIAALTVKSANDVAVVLAEGLEGTESRFAQKMTYRARSMGMNRTRFMNASGLPNDLQQTTARDMATLARRLINDFPEYYHYFSKPYFVWRGRGMHNHNRLLSSYEGMDGLKTGYIRASGYNLAASAVRDHRRLVAVVLGGASSSARSRAMTRLLDQGFAIPAGSMDVAALLGPARSEAAAVAAADSPTAAPRASTPGAASGTSRRPSATVRSRAETRRGSYGVQVGAFKDRGTATQLARKWMRAVGPLKRGEIAVGPSRSSRRLFLAQVVGLTRGDAQSACATLRRQRQPCMIFRSSESAEIGSN